MPENMDVMEIVTTLYLHNREHMVTENAGRLKTIRDLVVLGWGAPRAKAAVEAAAGQFAPKVIAHPPRFIPRGIDTDAGEAMEYANDGANDF